MARIRKANKVRQPGSFEQHNYATQEADPTPLDSSDDIAKMADRTTGHWPGDPKLTEAPGKGAYATKGAKVPGGGRLTGGSL